MSIEQYYNEVVTGNRCMILRVHLAVGNDYCKDSSDMPMIEKNSFLKITMVAVCIMA